MAQFQVSDYAAMQSVTGPYLWRCYLIKFAGSFTMTGILGGVVGSATLPAYCALFTSNEDAVPLSIVGYGKMEEVGVGQVIEIDPPLEVEPGEWYLLGQAGSSVSGSTYSMASVHRWDVPDMVEAEELLEEWRPVGYAGTFDRQFYGYSWGGSPHPETILGENWNPSGPPMIDARPYVGFIYEDFVPLGSWYTKKGGVWLPGTPSPKIGSSWKLPSGSWVRQGGTWKQVIS